MRLDRHRVRFDHNEAQFLLAAMRSADDSAWDDADWDSDTARRLYPDAYPGNADAESEFRELTHSSLQALRARRYEQCREELGGDDPIDLADDEVATRWIQMLNDLRLVIGTRLGVTEEPPEVDADSPEAGIWQLYGWLSYVQETLVTELMHRPS